jgi:GNAT superfamily N-acetyltransferase
MNITIKEAKTKKEIKTFMLFANELYKDEPNYIPPILSDEMKSANPKHNLSLEHCDTVLLLAYKGDQLVGRLRGLINHKYNDKNNVKHLRFNHFDVIDDFDVTKQLFDYLIQWGKTRGMNVLNGPIGFNDLEKQGLLIEGYEYEAMFITYYNFPYHKDHLEKLGLVKDVDWVEFQVQIPTEVNPKIARITERLLSRNNCKIKHFKNKRELKPYLYNIFDTYNEAFAPLHGVVELSQKQIDQYVKQYLPVINLEYLSVVVDNKTDDVIAFGLLAPSLNDSMRKTQGRLFPFGIFTILKGLKTTKVLDMYLVAVKPEYQGLGLNAILMSEITNNAIRNGIKYAETGPELEDNDKITSFWKNYDAKRVRRRRCYIKEI